MFLIITLNVVFAFVVVGGLVGLLSHSILASRIVALDHAKPTKPAARYATLRPGLDMA